MFGFGVLLAGEEEGADRDEAALAVGEVSPFRSKIEDRPTPGPRWREAEVHLDEFDHVAGRTHDRSHVVDPDVVRLGQIEFCLLRWYLQLQRLHHLAVFNPANVLLIGIAHPVRIA